MQDAVINDEVGQEGDYQKALEAVYKPEFPSVFPTGQTEERYTAFVSKVGEPMVTQITADQQLSQEEKAEELRRLRNGFYSGARQEVVEGHRQPSAYVEKLMEAMGKKDLSSLTDREKKIIKAGMVGLFATSAALGRAVGPVLALEQIALIEGRTAGDVVTQHQDVLLGMRKAFEERRDGQAVNYLDDTIRKKTGFIYRFKEPGSRDQLYAPPFNAPAAPPAK